MPGFWPAPETTHRIPFEREDLREELERLKRQRLDRRARRLEMEKEMQKEMEKEGGSVQEKR